MRELVKAQDIVHLPVRLEIVDDIERTSSGKMILVQDTTSKPTPEDV